MNQSQGPSTTDDEQGTRSDEQATGLPGVDRHHLRHYEQLHRSVSDRKIAGVAGGLGRHLNLDPTILRVLFVVLCFFGGAGFVLYGAAWLFVPEDGRDEGAVSMSPSTRNGVLIAAGILAALLVIGDSWHGIGFPWPVFLVGIGALVYLAVRDKDRPASSSAPDAPAPYAPEVADPSAGTTGGYAEVTTSPPDTSYRPSAPSAAATRARVKPNSFGPVLRRDGTGGWYGAAGWATGTHGGAGGCSAYPPAIPADGSTTPGAYGAGASGALELAGRSLSRTAR